MKKDESSEILIFNHFYKLQHDLKRSYIFSSDAIDKNSDCLINSEWNSRIHPIYAMIFSFFSQPIKLSEAIKQLSEFFEISYQAALDLINPFISNNESFHTEYADTHNNFPSNIIIDVTKAFSSAVQYYPHQFVYEELDFKSERLYVGPQGIVFMLNNTCATDCVYCYADRSVKRKTIPLNTIKSIIKNAYNIGVASFPITGGEFFLYKNWRELLAELILYKYKPALISTKVPLKEQDILNFKPYEIPIQISLDSLTNDKLVKILNVKEDYLEKMKRTIILLDQYKINFQIATVLTKYNDGIENLENIFGFLKNLKSLVRWEIRVAFKSLHSKENFDDLKIAKEKIKIIGEWIYNLRSITKVNILWSPDSSDKYFKSEDGSRKFLGSKCSANSTHMVLLPDGKVTICEQLYWDSRFIIGDLTKQSIEDTWHSQHALEIANPKKKDFSDKSACKTCNIFTECFSYPNKCFADVLKAYGKENWDYPDPRCNKAPTFNNELYHI